MSVGNRNSKEFKGFLVWGRKVAIWAGSGCKASFLYLLLLGVLCCIFFIDLPLIECKEREVRWAGIVLQIIGFCLVGWQLIKISRKFGVPSFLSRIATYWRRFPSPFKKNIELAVGFSGTMSGNFDARVKVVPGPHATLEKRVNILESEIKDLQGDLNKVNSTLNSQKDESKKSLEELRSDTAKEMKQIKELLNNAFVGEIHLDWIGFFYLLAGIVLASGAPEIAGMVGYEVGCVR